jgi:signal transduction histidine kinase
MQLEEHPFIQSIPESRRAELIAEAEILQLAPEAAIFAEQSPSDALYLILEGRVAFTKAMPDGSTQKVSESPAGGFFGEVGLLTDKPRTLGALAQGEAVVCRIPGSLIVSFMDAAFPVRTLLQNVIAHLDHTTEHYLNEVVRTEKLAVVGTMVASILHDFKNPFATISLGAHIIKQRQGDDAKIGKLCDNMEAQIQRMVRMANDLAAFARGESALQLEDVELDRLFTDFRELNRQAWETKPVTIELLGNGCILEADTDKLLRILQNLVGNAIEAIAGTGSTGHIRVSAEAMGEDVRITIEDDGPGIPPEIQANFFEPFVTRGKKGGTGLGSAIALSFVQAHKGTIHFDTGPSGTTFHLRFPRRQ